MSLIIQADWPAPEHVVAFTTTRDINGTAGHSKPPYDTWNLGFHVQDDPASVEANQALLASKLPEGAAPCWLQQVHGTEVVDAANSQNFTVADAAWTRSDEAACAVLTADCLPVLFCSKNGDVVAAAHAGWRGLLAGILERTVAAMACSPETVLAWLGPAIGPSAFEVGPEVRDQFLDAAAAAMEKNVASCFATSEERPGHYYADLYRLARIRLANCGIEQMYGGEFCTYLDSQRFYSYRRDGETGRMASLIAIAKS